MFELSTFAQITESYPMLKLAKNIVEKYQDKIITIKARYHYFLTDDGKPALMGYHVVFSNELTLSVFFGFGSYSSPKGSEILYPDNQMSYLSKAPCAEIAILNNNGLIHFDDLDDTVLGYQTPDEIMQVIENYIAKGQSWSKS